MQASDQGARRDRYHVIPRTLVFLTSLHPEPGVQEVLLLKGAPTKRLWANQYNGLGGHVEANEDVYTAARREVYEETGLAVEELVLRGVININTGSDATGMRPGVMIFVFRGEAPMRQVTETSEGSAHWIPLAQIADYPLVDDLFEVIPRVMRAAPLFYGYYWPDEKGQMHYRFAP